MHLVTTTKTLIQKLRDDAWETLLEEVTSFCKHQDIEVPNMNAYFSNVGRSRLKKKISSSWTSLPSWYIYSYHWSTIARAK